LNWPSLACLPIVNLDIRISIAHSHVREL
jgi:hypothetical protein